MTLIGFATYGDHAECITDTAFYTRNVEKLGLTTKHMTLNHLDAVLLNQGDSDFGDYAQVSTRKLADMCSTFDDLAARMQANLSAVHADLELPEDREATLFLVGYSEAAGEFVGYVYAPEQQFKPLKVRQWLMPTPWTLRPSGLELRRVRSDLGGRASWAEVEPRWTTQPTMTAPASVEEWVDLAVTAHRQRTLDHYSRVMVLGDLVHTRLERGTVTTKRVHTFTHTDEEFRSIVAETRHPLGQMQACWCESGQTFRDCHLRPFWNDPCGCFSGRTFYECCMVPDSASVPVA